MSVNGINNSTQTSASVYTNSKSAVSAETATAETSSTSKNEIAATYESGNTTSDTSKKVYKQDTNLVAQLKAESERRNQQLRSLVEKMLLKQGQTFNDASMYKLLRSGKLDVDAATIKQAQEDVAEDGYWGVNQTSDRIVSFAKALTGGDPEKADKMIEAFKTGFQQATKDWGDKLPDICQKTYSETLRKLDEWKNGTSDSE